MGQVTETRLIPIEQLPYSVSNQDAIELCYRELLDLTFQRLSQKYRVLIRCDKALNAFLYPALRTRFKRANHSHLTLIDGRPSAEEEGMRRAQVMIHQLTRFIRGGVSDQQIAFMTHLDVLSTSGNTPNPEAREVIPLLYEHPHAKLCAFVDPSFPLPKSLIDVFDIQLELTGVPREQLALLVTQREAKSLHATHFDPYLLYPYVSGLNAVKARRALSTLAELPEVSPLSPRRGEDARSLLRSYSGQYTDGVELPQVDLQRDIAGYHELKERFQRELIDLALARLKFDRPADIEAAEALTPKGALLYGPPGTGKTYFAKAIATSLQASLIVISGPELKSKWVGESEENLRRIFRRARAASPTVIVFDEIDSFAQSRGSYQTLGVEHSMVNQLLTEMDGFRDNEQIFVIGTTNFLSSVDGALLRPGRFELLIEIPRPDEATRVEILHHYNQRLSLELDETLISWLGVQTDGPADELGHPYTADHLQALCRALKRERLRSPERPWSERWVLEVLNRDRPPITLTEQERRVIATHECGHALVAASLVRAGRPTRISLRPDQHSLGHVKRLRDRSPFTLTLSDLRDEVCVLLGGLAAEQLVFGEHSVGAALDLSQATDIVRDLHGRYGMSSHGLMSWFPSNMTRDRSNKHHQEISTQSRHHAEEWVYRVLDEERERALHLVTHHKDRLVMLTEQLLLHEELTEGDLVNLLPTP